MRYFTVIPLLPLSYVLSQGSSSPSNVPSDVPSNLPSDVPSNLPSDVPSNLPSDVPSNLPSDAPSNVPSNSPTSIVFVPSNIPSNAPSNVPSGVLSNIPSITPSALPSTSSAPTCYTLGNDWFLQFLQATKVSDGMIVEEMTVQYLVSEGQQSERLRAMILDENCEAFTDNNAVFVEECTVINDDSSSCTDLGNVNVDFSEDSSVITSSPLWEGNLTYGCLNFCIKAELVDFLGLSVSFDESIYKICMSLDGEGTNFEVVPITPIPREKIPEIIYDPMNIDIEACVCEPDLTCSFFARAYQNSMIRICIRASNDAEIVSLSNVKFFQGDVPIFTAINNDGIPYPGLVSFSSGSVAVLTVQLISAYFHGSLLPLSVKGLAMLDSDVIGTMEADLGSCC